MQSVPEYIGLSTRRNFVRVVRKRPFLAPVRSVCSSCVRLGFRNGQERHWRCTDSARHELYCSAAVDSESTLLVMAWKDLHDHRILPCGPQQ